MKPERPEPDELPPKPEELPEVDEADLDPATDDNAVVEGADA